MPAARASRRPRRRLIVGAAVLVGAILLVGTGALTAGSQLVALLAPPVKAGGAARPDKGAAVLPPER